MEVGVGALCTELLNHSGAYSTAGGKEQAWGILGHRGELGILGIITHFIPGSSVFALKPIKCSLNQQKQSPSSE